MDIVQTIAARIGVDPNQAQAVAGALLGAARAQVPAEETQKLDAGVPELAGWMKAAESALAAPAAAQPPGADSGGLLGDLLEAAGSGLGNQILGAVVGKEASQAASAVAVLGKLGLEPKHATMVAPLIVEFLTSRLGAEWTDRIVAAAPALAGLASSGQDGGLGSLLQGFLPKS